MKRCIIITAYNPEGYPSIAKPLPGDTIICADSGYLLAKEQGLHPHYIMGDFDSENAVKNMSPEDDPYFCGSSIVRVPAEKDDTDTMLCIRHGLSLGCDDFTIVGGIGGRLDHTIANLQSLAYLKDRGVNAVMTNPTNRVFLADPGTLALSRNGSWKFSLFAFTARCHGVTLQGAKYPLTNATLESSFPLGISNEFAEETVLLSFTEGRLMVVLSCGN